VGGRCGANGRGSGEEELNSGLVKGGLIVGAFLAAIGLAYFAYTRPGYFTSQTYIAGLIFLEGMAAAVWFYRRAFFPVVIVTFLLAGVELPVGAGWNMARWIVLAIGAMVGATIMLRERRYHFGMFHVLAFFAVLAALMSSAVSRFGGVSSLKVLSLLLLFVYAATGARLAVANRESRFFSGLLLGCEIFVAAVGAFYFMGREVMGNPNSLGAVMGVVAAPVLLWGTLLDEDSFTHRRRLLFFAIAMYMTFSSHARAGILAALVSCAVLCIALRKYRLLIQGIGILAIVVATSAIVQPEAFSAMISSFTSTIVYKGKDPSEGMLGSRKSPWQDTIDTIHVHPWFGTGFGTADTGQDPTDNLSNFSSSSTTSTEHGSSYLEIVSWVGLIGIWPFVFLILSLLRRIFSAVAWMHKTATPYHPVVPLSLIILAGLVHAGFEDWLFAPGYYLCAFFWSMAFVLVDQVMLLPVPQLYGVMPARAIQVEPVVGTVAPSR
jgi:O-antigen ligase